MQNTSLSYENVSAGIPPIEIKFGSKKQKTDLPYDLVILFLVIVYDTR